MKLSEFQIETMEDEQIDKIVFDELDLQIQKADVAIVFGNSNMIEERVRKAVELYNSEMVSKLLFTGRNRRN